MGGRPRPREKPQRARWRVASPSPAPKPRPQATGGDGPPRGGDGAGASPTGSPSPRSPPAGAAPARSTPSPATPGAHPRITHGALIHHVHAAPSYERHPRARGPRRATTRPGTGSGAPSKRFQGISKFPGTELAALLLSLHKPLLQTTASPRRRMHFRQAAAGRRSTARGGPRPPEKGSPIPTPPSHSPLPSRSRLPGRDAKGPWQGADATPRAPGAP